MRKTPWGGPKVSYDMREKYIFSKYTKCGATRCGVFLENRGGLGARCR